MSRAKVILFFIMFVAFVGLTLIQSTYTDYSYDMSEVNK